MTNDEIKPLAGKAMALALTILLILVVLCSMTGCVQQGYSPAAAYGWQGTVQAAPIGVHVGSSGVASYPVNVKNASGMAQYVR